MFYRGEQNGSVKKATWKGGVGGLRELRRRWLGSLIGSLALLVLGPAQVQAAPFAYVTNLLSNSVSVIDTATNEVINTIPVGGGYGVAVNPAGTFVYATNHGNDTVSVIDASTNTVVDTVSVGDGPAGLAVHPDGTLVYVANFYSNDVSLLTLPLTP